LSSNSNINPPSDSNGRTQFRLTERFPALASRNFCLLLIGQGISGIGSFMQIWAINWQLYALTHKAIALGLIGLFRIIPIVLFSLIGGTVADAMDRRKVMYCTQTTLAGVALILGILTATHHLTPAWIYALTMLGAAAMAFDNPARQSLIPSLVEKKHLTNALSMMSVSFRTSTIIGPVLAGFFIARGGLGETYFLNAISFLAVIGALIAMRLAPVVQTAILGIPNEVTTDVNPPPQADVSLRALKEGMLFVWKSPILVSTLLLDAVASFFSSANSLLPIFAKDILKIGARGYGFLAAAEAVGALLAGIALSFIPSVKRQGLVIIWSVVIYGFATIAFGMSRVFLLSWIALALFGASDAVSTVLRQTIRQLATPNRLRGRMTSVNMIFFMGGPQLGELESGIAAQLLGAPLAVIIGGIGCLLTVGVVAMKAPMLAAYVLPDEKAAAEPVDIADSAAARETS
jgi:MFS family permease